MPRKPFRLLCLLVPLATLAQASVASAADDGDWLDFDPEASHRAIGDETLRFLADPPDQAAHHHQNTLTLQPDSLTTGWVRMEQCHRDLDVFPRTQIVYRPGRIRGLKVVQERNIGAAWVEGASVQLRDVQRNAELCVQAETRALADHGDGRYSLRSGPFMRRFLDGYFPMRVSLSVRWPADRLRLVEVRPAAREGVKVEVQPGHVALDAWFEGRLETEIVLERKP